MGPIVEVDTAALPDAPAELLRAAARHVVLSENGPVAELSVALLDDAAIRELNARYLGKDAPTDVIAFALGDDAERVGDVYVGVDQARRQAAEHGVPLDEELVRLVVHGTLHVLGHDHPDGPERAGSPMFAVQERLVAEVLGGR